MSRINFLDVTNSLCLRHIVYEVLFIDNHKNIFQRRLFIIVTFSIKEIIILVIDALNIILIFNWFNENRSVNCCFILSDSNYIMLFSRIRSCLCFILTWFICKQAAFNNNIFLIEIFHINIVWWFKDTNLNVMIEWINKK